MPINSTVSSVASDSPAISVIISMYNVEKYIGKCLAGLLTQTFKDFEVIVIDDCSNDNGVAIVEGYAEKFNGRLTFLKSEKKSEYEGFLRNKGIELGRGKYVSFIEPDDVITSTELEELYSAAEKFNAEVVHCEKYYFIPDESNQAAAHREKSFITQPTFLTNDFERRVRDFSRNRSQRDSWVQLVRRDFLIANGIHFLNICSQDMVFMMCELCCAKRYLLLPDIFHHWRQRDALNAQEESDTPQTIQKYASTLKQSVNYLDEFLNGQDFFAARADLRYMLFDTLFAAILERLNDTYKKISAHEICELLRKEFDGDNAFTAFVFNAMNVYRLQLNPPQESLDAPAVEVLPASYKEKNFFPKEFPVVSVIIPMYNVEKYVGECLDSLLAQTFQNFEIIVVDDCSTDNSRAVVESYVEKFEGRLKIAALEKNSGGAGFPRNKGIELARGEYLSFIDPDDAITPTALEELYSAAKNFDADVVHCEKWYQIPDEFYHDTEYRKKLKPCSWPMGEKRYIDQPALLTSDLEKRIVDFGKMWLIWSVCLQFIRRKFIIDNGIRFSDIYSEDMIFTMCELCCAKRYLVLPNVFYFYRLRSNSAVRETFDVPKIIHNYAKTLKQGINYLDGFFNRQEFFANQSDLHYILFKTFATVILSRVDRVYRETPIHMLDKFLRKEFNDAFAAFTFNAMNVYRLQQNLSPKRIVVPEIETDYKDSEGQIFLASKMPAISVIIPLYNAEKYIGELLDSILVQTFQDFEVIVVDDCSTDNGRAVVESCAPKFHGRLRLIATEKNTGSPGDPSNIGIDLSRGEYLFILDDDDAITPDALEKLYYVAKNFDADVVSCENFYLVPEKSWYDEEYRKNLTPHSYKKGDFVNKPTLIPFDIARRVQDCFDRKFLWSLWSKLIRRDLMIENKIRCTNNIIQDMLVTCCLIYTAKRFVCVPYTVYFWRMQDESLSNKKRAPVKKLKKYLSALTVGMRYLDGFLNKREFFQQNLNLMHTALNTYFKENMNFYIQPIYDEIPANEREMTLRKEFANAENAALTAFLFNDLTKILKSSEDKTSKFLPYLNGRVDIQLNPKNESGNLQIISVSDNNADIARASWLPKNEIGYAIQSRKGDMEIVAKATADGQIKLYLRGFWALDPADNSKLLPYWIDYTKLTVNDKVIFDKVTPAWHDAPFNYNLEVKEGEEIRIQTEWLPHRGGVSADEIKPSIAPKSVARIDFKLETTDGGDFQLLSVSDDKADVTKASWLTGNNIGYFIQSDAGKLEIVTKVVKGGVLVLGLRGRDVRDPEDKSKRIPDWIDYTKLTLNGKIVFNKLTPAWHDKPYSYITNIETDDEIVIQVEWLLHNGDDSSAPTAALPVQGNDAEIINRFKRWFSARLDLQMITKNKRDFQIISISDDRAEIRQPGWFNRNGVGYVIQSYVGKLTIVFKVIDGGTVDINLKGLFYVDPKDKSKHIPYWVDYTKFTVNDKVIFNKPTPIWHDKPFNHTLEAKAGDEITVSVEWLPHRSDV